MKKRLSPKGSLFLWKSVVPACGLVRTSFEDPKIKLPLVLGYPNKSFNSLQAVAFQKEIPAVINCRDFEFYFPDFIPALKMDNDNLLADQKFL